MRGNVLARPAWVLPPGHRVLTPRRLLPCPRHLSATARQWQDEAVTATLIPERIRATGLGGLASLFEAMTRGMNVTRTVARLRVSGPDRYRLDFSRRLRRILPTTIACDGERRWRVFQDRTVVGPAVPLRHDIAFLADSCWLLRGRLSGGAKLTYRGRPARQLRVTPVPGGEEVVPGPLMIFPADAIVDAETGCLLRLISYAGDTLAVWSELDDISTEPADPDEFRVHVPPGTRIVEETGT
jgi:hypothetical protein